MLPRAPEGGSAALITISDSIATATTSVVLLDEKIAHLYFESIYEMLQFSIRGFLTTVN